MRWTAVCWGFAWLLAGCVGGEGADDPPTDGDADTDADADADADTDADVDTATDTTPIDTSSGDCYGKTSRVQAATWTGSTGSTTTSTGGTTTWTGTTTTTTTYWDSGVDTASPVGRARIWLDARWTIDENGCVASGFIDGNEIVPQLNFRIGAADWALDLDLVDQYCTVQFVLAGGTPNPPWVVAYPALYWGLSHDGVQVATDCLDVDPELFTSDPAGFLLGLGRWGVAVGPLDAEVEAAIVAAALDPLDYAGGAMMNPWVTTQAPQNKVYVRAYQTDVDENLIVDAAGDAIGIPGADIDLGGGQIAQGYYDMFSYYYWQL